MEVNVSGDKEDVVVYLASRNCRICGSNMHKLLAPAITCCYASPHSTFVTLRIVDK